MLYLQETIRVVPGKFEEYVEAAEKKLVPLYHDLGFRLVSFWETVSTQGYWPEVMSLWEMDDFAHYGSICAKQYSDGPMGKRFREWQRQLGSLATSAYGMVLWPSSGTPTLDQMKKSGKRAKIIVHEWVKTTPTKSHEYTEQLQRLWTPEAARYGRWMVGTYRVYWRNTEAVNIWALEDWDTIGKYQQKMQLDSVNKDDPGHTWAEVGMALRTDWDDRVLTALPFSPI